MWNGLDDEGRREPAADLAASLEGFNLAGDRAIVAPAEYREVVAVRRR